MIPCYYDALCAAAGKDNVRINEPMRNHTSFRIGGPADCFVTVPDADSLNRMIGICVDRNVPYFILGNGTNLLVSDHGFRGVIFCIRQYFSKVEFEGDRVRAGAGILLSALSAAAADHSMTGLEFASGIPGTLGGALVMNAGAYGGEIRDVVTDVTVLNPGNGVETVSAKDMAFGYRTSVLKHTNKIALCACLRLKKGSRSAINAEMERLKAERLRKQPIEYPSAGSAFQRPDGHFAGKLIMDARLAGFRVGDAAVSDKHCGFIINKGRATAIEVLELMHEIVWRVRENSGVTLTPEIRFLGDFGQQRYEKKQ